MVMPQIQHVFVLQMENRSFDQVLGWRAGVDGVDPSHVNRDKAGTEHRQQALAGPSARVFLHDPPHHSASVARQIANQMSGFVTEFEHEHASKLGVRPGEVMQHFTRDQQPITNFLADHFAISDRWFTPIPTQTIPNRLYSIYGHSCGVRDNPSAWRYFRGFAQDDSIFQQLDRVGVDWRVYAGAIPGAALVRGIRPELLGSHLSRLPRLAKDLDAVKTAADAALFPRLTWIEPSYSWTDFWLIDPVFPTPNDDHPPSDVRRGQALIQYVYDAIRKSALWPNALLVIFYDEHGGFYDHVPPPPCVPQADGFTQRGPRVPAIVVSPFVAPGSVVRPAAGQVFDHCSVLKFLCDQHGIVPWSARLTDPSLASLGAFVGPAALAQAPAPPLDLTQEHGLGITELPGAIEAPEESRESDFTTARLYPGEHAVGLDDLRLGFEQADPAAFARLYPELAKLPPLRREPAPEAPRPEAAGAAFVPAGPIVPPNVPVLPRRDRPAPAAPAAASPPREPSSAEEELRRIKEALGGAMLKALVALDDAGRR